MVCQWPVMMSKLLKQLCQRLSACTSAGRRKDLALQCILTKKSETSQQSPYSCLSPTVGLSPIVSIANPKCPDSNVGATYVEGHS